MDFKETPYFHAGQASDLEGKDYYLYRFFEMVPGILAWGTIIGTLILSRYVPVYAAYFIIMFDLFWFLKTVYLSIHLRHNWRRMRHNMKIDWQEMISHMKYEHLVHLVILPYYNEGRDVIEKSIKGLLASKYKKNKMYVVLGVEERAGESALQLAEEIKQKYEAQFGEFHITIHPKDLPGEMPGKGSNISWAAEKARTELLDKNQIPYENVIVSAFDIDTIVYPQYFTCLTWHFLTQEDPYRVSYQPVPLYNNNVWEAPALSRVVAMSSTFWQMIQQEREEKLTTFSSHSVSFKTLYECGYWQRNMVSEDSRIFWNIFMARDGDYGVVPLSYPVSMDANLAPSFWQTSKNIYKQHRRWSWGAENIPYILMAFAKNKKISLKKKVSHTLTQLEGFWSLATNPLIIILLGWMPLILGGTAFTQTVLSYNLPFVTRNLMILAMGGLLLNAILALYFIPKVPKDLPRKKRTRKIYMFFQWLLVPITIIVFGAIPGLDAQTRLMIGKGRLGFWVTPKHREQK